MKKYLISALAAVILITAVFIPSSALIGKWEGVEWVIAGNYLVVSGGDIPDCSASHAAPWQKFSSKVSVLIIDSSVTAVGDRAFEDMSGISSVYFENVKSIGDLAFSGCASLVSVYLPDGLTDIGRAAFAECTALETVSLPVSVQSIGDSVWEACPALYNIDVRGADSASDFYSDGGVLIDQVHFQILRYPSAKKGDTYTAPAFISSVASGAFRDAVNLRSVDLKIANSIGDGAFYGCTSLDDVAMKSVSKIGRSAFFGCTSLETVTIPASAASVGANAFSYCTSLAKARFDGNAPEAGDGIFDGCSAAFCAIIREEASGFGDADTWHGYPLLRHGVYSGELDDISWKYDSYSEVLTVSGNDAQIPDFESPADAPWYEYRRLTSELELVGITSVGKNSFRYAALRTLSLPAEVQSVGEWAFSGCAELTEVRADQLKTVGDRAFFGDYALVTVSLKGVRSIGEQSFSGCDALRLAIMGSAAPTLGSFAFDGTDVSVIHPVGGTGYGVDGGEGWTQVYHEAYLPGDADGSGEFDAADVVTLLRYLAGWNISIARISADADGNFVIDAADPVMMLRALAGWSVEIGIEI